MITNIKKSDQAIGLFRKLFWFYFPDNRGDWFEKILAR